MQLPDSIMITEVGPRDGLQNEPEQVPVQEKIDFINQLSACGFPEIEATAFVSPRWVPQLADAAEVLAGIQRVEGVAYSALVPNIEGWERAQDANVDKISVFTAASETFSKRNTNATIEETLNRFQPVVHAAREAGCPVRAYVSCAVACPFEGKIAPAQVKGVVDHLLDLGVTEIDLGDTIGMATPSDMDALVEVVADRVPPEKLVLHLHDTRGTALACCYRAMQLGVRRFDASCGGLGGCPYAPGATGNLATEDLLFLARGLGIPAGVDASGVLQASAMMERSLDRPLVGRVYRAESCSEEA
ncbi:MAG: hydroxymethylglutaryl-CoA lyase [Phycisphaerales bacterium]|nr:hydroxymethylglutaryl-CoA lyase [Phycisphaerales bacterium]